MTSRTDITDIEPLAYSVEGALRVIPTSRAQLNIWLSTGQLRSVKAGRRTWILRADLVDFLSKLPAREIKNAIEQTAPSSAQSLTKVLPVDTSAEPLVEGAPMMARRIPPSTHIQSPPARRPLRKR